MSLRLLIRTPSGSERTLFVSRERLTAPQPDYETIDARHLYTVAGLGDGHLHLAARSIEEFISTIGPSDMNLIQQNAAIQLQSGVLAALDKGDRDGSALRALDLPADQRPQLEMAGPINRSADGYYPGIGSEVDGADLVRAAGRSTRATWFKLIGDWPRRGLGPVPSYSAEDLGAAVGAAHRARRRVAVHTMARETPSHAVHAGVDSIEHGLFLTEADLRTLGARGGYWVPTVLAMEEVGEQLGSTSSGGKLIAAGLDNVRALLEGAPAMGVNVLAGSDLGGSHGLIAREAARLVDYGLSTPDALAAVTTNVAEAIGKPSDFEEGDPADVVCVAGDPCVDITALEQVRLVIRRGRIVLNRV